MFTNMGMVLFLLKWKKDLVEGNRLKQDFLSQIRGNNSLTLDRNFTKFASCTSSTLNKNFSQVLTHYQMINFRLFQTERVYRRQFQILMKMSESFPNE